MRKLKIGMTLVGLMLVGLFSFAGLTNYPNGVSSFGVPVLGSGDIVTTGTVYFVDSTYGSNGNSGTSTDQALKTLEYALESKVTANKGDIVVLMPGFSETVTSAIAWTVGGVKVIGIGHNARLHTLTTATANINLIDLSGDYCTIQNVRFSNTATNTGGTLYEMLDVATTGLTVKSCVFDLSQNNSLPGINLATGGYSDNTIQNCDFILSATSSGRAGISTGATRTNIIGCVFDYSHGGSVAIDQITLSGGGDACTIKNNIFKGNGATAGVTNFIRWQASPGAGHAVENNRVVDDGAAAQQFGNDTDLDYMFIDNKQGAADGSESLLDPS